MLFYFLTAAGGGRGRERVGRGYGREEGREKADERAGEIIGNSRG